MIFPGQGAQSVGMLTAAKQQHAVVDETLAEANEALGLDLAEVIDNGPAETLDKTEYTQPALVAASIAYWRSWQQAGGPMPTHLAGHSLGEYSALVVAGAMDFGDALRLTRLRGQAMQGAVEAGQGTMAAIIGLSDDDVVAACQAAGDELADQGLEVSAANFNAPMQVVIAGHADAVARAGEIAERIAADEIIRRARVGNLPALSAPWFPEGSILITSYDNLSRYEQEGSRRRKIEHAPQRRGFVSWESFNEAFVVEVHGDGEIELTVNLDARRHENFPDRHAVGTGLWRN